MFLKLSVILITTQWNFRVVFAEGESFDGPTVSVSDEFLEEIDELPLVPFPMDSGAAVGKHRNPRELNESGNFLEDL